MRTTSRALASQYLSAPDLYALLKSSTSAGYSQESYRTNLDGEVARAVLPGRSLLGL
jgi:hypothetical protein